MKAQELRLGNYFQDFELSNEGGGIFQVEQICYNQKGKGRLIGVRFRNGSCWSCCDIIEPIPLNEEWLLKFGFDNKNNPTQTSFIHWIKKIQTYNGSSCFFKIYQEKNKLNYKKNMEGKMIKEFMFFYKEMGVINLDYVHSLQNLYACLTNKELTLKD